ncbi:MAG: reprolysin-like metallopeptidase, partial [Saprospiraceae bacterium]
MTKPKAYITTVFVLCYILLAGQNKWWRPIDIADANRDGTEQKLIGKNSQVYHLDIRAFRQILLSMKRDERDTLSIEFPMPDGSFRSFILRETPVFDQESSDKYVDYHSYTGQSHELHTATLKLSMSPFGIHAMVLLADGSAIYLDPYFVSGDEYYVLYRKQDVESPAQPLHCNVLLSDQKINTKDDRLDDEPGYRSSQECIKRVYRLALACTGEYGMFYGGTIEKVLAAYNMTMTRVNGIYERDLAISFLMVSDTDKLIYLDGNTDPFVSNNNDAIINQNQSNTDKIIGFSRYDIGHIFTTVNSGLARIRSLCTSSKAMGVSGRTNPIGDPFDIDYVCHELGHQLGANHTQNNDCNRTAATAVEPGSGSTIMGYAGICTPNIQNNSDSYFHAVSLGEIQDYISMRSMVTCGNRTILDKMTPTISVSKASHTIPISTSFVLDAQTTGDTGNNLSFSWEQTDTEVALMPPRPTNTSGPAFRSLPPSASPARYFPDLLRRHIQWEVLPSVSRAMNFRCTVRDNDPSGGCTDFASVEVKVSNQAGPFVVLAPNTTTVVWPVGSPQIISWDVAKTNLTPVNCTTVDIFLSTDGGVSYPTQLAKDVPNTGQCTVTTPFLPTVTAKIMVKASDNIFFDVSEANFSIVSTFSTAVSPMTFDVCARDTLVTSIGLQKLTGSTLPITLSMANLQPGIMARFDVNPITSFPRQVTLTMSGFDQLGQGKYAVSLIATSGIEKTFTKLDIFKETSIPITTALIRPLDGIENVEAKSVRFLWHRVTGASKYQLEWSTSPAFKVDVFTIITTDTSYENKLEEANIYFWRVKAVSPCAQHPYSATQSFRTKDTPVGSINLIYNEWLLADRGGSAALSNALLQTSGSKSDQIIYTILTNTKNGQLTLRQKSLNVGDRFTQEDIDVGNLVYHHANSNDTTDFFMFNVVDDKNRWMPSAVFNIRIKNLILGAILHREKTLLCARDQNAIISAFAFGGQPPYAFSRDGLTYVDSSRFVDVGAGMYQVFVKDGIGNIAKTNVVLISQQIPITAVVVTDK